jgi:hypothetical protein
MNLVPCKDTEYITKTLTSAKEVFIEREAEKFNRITFGALANPDLIIETKDWGGLMIRSPKLEEVTAYSSSFSLADGMAPVVKWFDTETDREKWERSIRSKFEFVEFERGEKKTTIRAKD